MGTVAVADRDQLITAFRQRICQTVGIVPFLHQAQWWGATDGVTVTGETCAPEEPGALQVLDPDERHRWVRTVPRRTGRARVIADLGSFKIGKSFGAGVWLASFAAVPHARVSLVGLEYDICAPEFEYICELLLSDRGLGLAYDSLQNRPRDGRMWLDLPNGARFDARSWERKDTLKGKEVDAYCFCEAFMLPDASCYTGVKQNLSKRKGFALFPTTPDRPWVAELHDRGHDHPHYPDWHCTCAVPRTVNPYTFDQAAMDQDDPDKGGLMTKEKFAIAYLGRLGDYVGRVYNYQRGDLSRTFTTTTHPHLWRHPLEPPSLANLRLPESYTVLGGADTGTFLSGGLVALSDTGDAFVLAECPNYRYVSSEPELDPALSIPVWANTMGTLMTTFGVRGLWADQNSQYRRELSLHHGITLLRSPANLQTRTEITREYLQAGKLWLAPWLTVLPFELEYARWPDEAGTTGRFERLKRYDHTLDCVEHILARRPRGRFLTKKSSSLWVEDFTGRPWPTQSGTHVHLGVH